MVSQAERRAATVAAILAAAQRQFATKGFEATTIDDIAARAGVAKGAVYHHFDAKEQIFERVLESVLAGMAKEVSAAAAAGKTIIDSMVIGTQKYLECATARGTRRLLLVDGPVVLGWNKWRELDQRHFGRLTGPALAALKPGMSSSDVEALIHLLTGAITEAALVCATAREPRKKARELAAGLRLLLGGLTQET